MKGDIRGNYKFQITLNGLCLNEYTVDEINSEMNPRRVSFNSGPNTISFDTLPT